MNTINSMPAGSFRQQKTLSNYTTRNEFTEALHTLLSCKDFHIPSPARTIIKFYKSFIVSKEHIGVLNARYEIIAEYTKKSKRTIERGFKWLKDVGLITTRRTTKQDGTRGADYKVFASLAAVKTFVADRVADRVADCQSSLSPWESKPEQPKNETDISSFIKKQKYKNKDINNNRFRKNDSAKKYGIKKEVKELLSGNGFAWDDIAKYEVAQRLQMALKKDETYTYPLTIEQNKKAVIKALKSFITTYEKQPENIRERDTYFGLLYKCVRNALLTKGHAINKNFPVLPCFVDGQEELQKPQEATEAPENDLEYFDIQTEQTDEQEQNEEPTEEDYAEAFCYGHPFAEHKPFEIFDRELNSLGEWETPLMPLTDKDELKYYDRIIEQEEEQEEPVKEYANSY